MGEQWEGPRARVGLIRFAFAYRPILAPLRAQYHHLFSSQTCTLRQFVWQPDAVAVALYCHNALHAIYNFN